MTYPCEHDLPWYSDPDCDRGGTRLDAPERDEDAEYEAFRQQQIDDEDDARRKLEAARVAVNLRLDSIVRSCEHEKIAFRSTGEIADGEISIPYEGFEQAVQDFREAQESLEARVV